MAEPISVVELQARRVVTIRRTVPQRKLGGFFMEIFPKMHAALAAQGAAATGPTFARYYNADPSAFDTEAGVPFTGSFTPSGEMRVSELQGGKAAKVVHIGPYDTLSNEYRRIRSWLDDRKETARTDLGSRMSTTIGRRRWRNFAPRSTGRFIYSARIFPDPAARFPGTNC